MVYKILRWDSIEQNNQIVPMIYFQPCLKIVNIMKLNNNKVSIQITGTAMYDGIYNGVANKSSILPNCRPNFFEATNLHVIILNTIFLKYPDLDKMGTFEIFKILINLQTLLHKSLLHKSLNNQSLNNQSLNNQSLNNQSLNNQSLNNQILINYLILEIVPHRLII